jgi:predicted Zn-dependent protease
VCVLFSCILLIHGNVELLEGQTSSAIDKFNQVHSGSEGSRSVATYNLALAHYENGNPGRAITLLRPLMQKQPGNTTLGANLQTVIYNADLQRLAIRFHEFLRTDNSDRR